MWGSAFYDVLIVDFVCVEGCAVEYGGIVYGLWWVWLERCKDGSYAVNALCCDVWVVSACVVVCIVACYIGFWGSVFWWKCIPS